MNKTSDFIEFDRVLNKGLSLLKDDKKCRIGFYIIFSVNTGLRISDVLNIKHKDLQDDVLIIREMKTQKQREISLNQVVQDSYAKLITKFNENGIKYAQDDYVFISQKGTVYRTQSINEVLKTIFKDKKYQISSHSLRKSFARRVYQNLNESEDALILLSDIFRHSSISITRRYLGIRKETISNVYLTLV